MQHVGRIQCEKKRPAWSTEYCYFNWSTNLRSWKVVPRKSYIWFPNLGKGDCNAMVTRQACGTWWGWTTFVEPLFWVKKLFYKKSNCSEYPINSPLNLWRNIFCPTRLFSYKDVFFILLCSLIDLMDALLLHEQILHVIWDETCLLCNRIGNKSRKHLHDTFLYAF